jgi:Ca-activated chloride channel homolog
MRGFALALLVAAQIFRAGTDAVRVDALVTSGNKPIGGLTAADFEILDNGVPQDVANVTIEEVPFSMLLVLDTSASMKGSPLDDLKAAATAAVTAIRAGDRASIFAFSDVLRHVSPWKSKGDELTRAIGGLQASGATALFDAAFASLMLRDPDPGRRSLILLFSDGEDTSSWLPAAAAIDKATRSDAVVYAVVLGPPTDRGRSQNRAATPAGAPISAANSERGGNRRLLRRSGITLTPDAPLIEQSPLLHELAERTGGEAMLAESSGNLRATFERIVTDFRSRYLLSYVPKGVDAPGWHKIEVKVKGRRANVKARRGYER